MVANRKHLLNKFELYVVPQDKVNVFFGRGGRKVEGLVRDAQSTKK